MSLHRAKDRASLQQRLTTRLTKAGAAPMHLFLRANDQYACGIVECAQQRLGENFVSLEASNPAQLKYFLDTKWLRSLIDIGFISELTSYEDLSNEELQTHLVRKAEEAKDVFKFDTLDKLVEY